MKRQGSTSRKNNVTLRLKSNKDQALEDGEWIPSGAEIEVYYQVVTNTKTYKQAAEFWNVSENTVRNKLKDVNEWLVLYHMDGIRRMKVEHTAKLEWAALQLLEAWEKSKANAVEVTDNEGGGENTVVRSTKTKGQVGNPAYLAQYRECLKDIRALWGVDAPVKIDHTHDLRVAGMPVEEANAELVEQIDEHRKRLILGDAS